MQQAIADNEPMTVVVDLDGIICEYDGYKGPGVFGPIRSEAVHLLKMFSKKGFGIHIYTSRSWYEYPNIKAMLDVYGVPYSIITCGKPIGVLYIDDRGTGLGGDLEQARRWLDEHAGE